jgi:hypothetical protein
LRTYGLLSEPISFMCMSFSVAGRF